MENYKLKLTIFILLIIILSITLFYGIFGFSLSYLTEEEIKSTRKLDENLISFFKINNIETIYDKEKNIYYYSIPLEYNKKKYTLKIDLDEGYKYKIVDYSTNIITVDYSKEYNIIIYNDKYYYEATIQLTNLPLISITTDADITDNDTNSVFKYINPSNLDEIVTYNSKIHIRGATSKLFDKKSYRLNIYDNEYDKEKNINISNFYYGSSFILDSMYRDDSKIRNVLATQIWNDIALDFTNVNVYNEYVELFINNKHMGIYVFGEPINRKNLNLNKSGSSDTSVVIKTNNWEIPSTSNSYSNITDNKYLGYEIKYPNDQELFNITWNKFLNKLSPFYAQTKTYDFINNDFNINNYIDIVLFNSFVNNTDNKLIKNNYFYMKNLNDKIYIQPWDLEFTFGLRYSANAEYGFEKTLDDCKNIEFDIRHEDKKINKLLVKRYHELRKNIFTKKYFDELINKYKNDLKNGASKRDSQEWKEYNVEKEIEEVRSWLYNRIKVYDAYMENLENE